MTAQPDDARTAQHPGDAQIVVVVSCGWGMVRVTARIAEITACVGGTTGVEGTVPFNLGSAWDSAWDTRAFCCTPRGTDGTTTVIDAPTTITTVTTGGPTDRSTALSEPVSTQVTDTTAMTRITRRLR